MLRRQQSGTEETLQNVRTVHFLEGRTPFCPVCTQWQGNTQAQTALTVQFPHGESANQQMLLPEATSAKPWLRGYMAVLQGGFFNWQATVR